MGKLKIKIPEEKIKLTLKIKKSSSDALNDYAIYMSELHKIKISSETIMESLIEKLLKDKDFQNFRNSNLERKGAFYAEKTISNSKKKEGKKEDNDTSSETEKIF